MALAEFLVAYGLIYAVVQGNNSWLCAGWLFAVVFALAEAFFCLQ